MKLMTIEHNGANRVGIVQEETGSLVLISASLTSSVAGIVTWDIEKLQAAAKSSAEIMSIEDLNVLAPIPAPRRNIFCVGKNYFDHAHEFAKSGFDSSAASGAVPDAPIVFSKVPESVTGPNTPILFNPDVTHEMELAVKIGQGGSGISKADVLNHVWGYTIINDVTARDWQGRHKQWLLGKSLPTFCPMGPLATSADEINLANTPVRTFVNGELRQESNTADLIFDVPTLISTISTAVPLLAGDIIATGTPAGVLENTVESRQ